MLLSSERPIYAREAGGPGASSREADEDIEEAYREMGASVSGRVVNVNDAMQSIVIQDEELDDQTYHYSVRPDTRFVGARSLRDIMAGDLVRVDYFTIEGKRIATDISIEKRYVPASTTSGSDYKLPGDLIDIGKEHMEAEGSSGSDSTGDGVLKDLSD
ncbi:hypothetical protein ACFL3N_00525 [Candidatus Omnitrophota bacterium]